MARFWPQSADRLMLAVARPSWLPVAKTYLGAAIGQSDLACNAARQDPAWPAMWVPRHGCQRLDLVGVAAWLP